MTLTLDATDRAILDRVQDDIPCTTHPFAEIGAELGLSEALVLDRLTAMRASGTLTRFGPFFDAEAMGGAFCLCAIAVPEVDFDTVTTQVNAHPEVAHNYARAHDLNMWFVLATETQNRIAEIAKTIEEETGLKVFLFPKEQEYFVGFRVPT